MTIQTWFFGGFRNADGRMGSMASVSHTDTSDIIIRCDNCDKTYKIHPEKLPAGISAFPCRACGTLISIPRARVGESSNDHSERVLVVVEEEELGKLIQRLLNNSGYACDLANSGKKAIEILKGDTSELLLVSVYLPDMMGYELLDKVKDARSQAMVPSILLSAVHHAARYKRAPTSLYGADDYLERHHLPDLLIPKIRRLLSSGAGSTPQVTPGDIPPPTDDQVRARRDLEIMERSGPNPQSPQMGEVQRMCRVIAGDIALYNEDIITRTTPEKIFDAIASDLSEGEALLMSKFPEMEDQLSHLLKGEMLRLLHSRGIQVS